MNTAIIRKIKDIIIELETSETPNERALTHLRKALKHLNYDTQDPAEGQLEFEI